MSGTIRKTMSTRHAMRLLIMPTDCRRYADSYAKTANSQVLNKKADLLVSLFVFLFCQILLEVGKSTQSHHLSICSWCSIFI